MLAYVIYPQTYINIYIYIILFLTSYLVPLDIAQVFHLIVVEVVFADVQFPAVYLPTAAQVLQVVPGQLARNAAFCKKYTSFSLQHCEDMASSELSSN